MNKVSNPNFDSPQLLSYWIFFAQIFRIVRAVPETLNSGAFLFKKIVFGNSKFSKCDIISEKTSPCVENWVPHLPNFRFSQKELGIRRLYGIQDAPENLSKKYSRRKTLGPNK